MSVCTWANSVEETRGKPYTPATGIRVQHIEEDILFALAESRVDILLTIIIKVDSPTPTKLHLVHRRHVSAEDRTPSFFKPESFLERIMQATRGECLKANDKDKTIDFVPINGQVLNGPLRAKVPVTEGLKTSVGFGLDVKLPADLSIVPFTSVYYGPFEASEVPFAFRVAFVIREPTFSKLVIRANQFGVKYHYGIEGPDFVRSDIENVDLYQLPSFIERKYCGLFEAGIISCPVHIENYDILAIENPTDRFDYNRVYVKSEHIVQDLIVSTPGERKVKVNGWHSNRSNFLIQRVSIHG